MRRISSKSATCNNDRVSATHLLMTRAMLTHTKGKECTKLVVPSRGSHLGRGQADAAAVRCSAVVKCAASQLLSTLK